MLHVILWHLNMVWSDWQALSGLLLKKKHISAAVLLVLWCLAGCAAQDDGPLCLDDCELCTEEKGCPPDRCGIYVILAGDCEEEFEFAEVTVDNCLEEEDLLPGTSMLTCATVKLNQERWLVVRADNWIWKERIKCTQDSLGRVITRTLYCLAQDE